MTAVSRNEDRGMDIASAAILQQMRLRRPCRGELRGLVGLVGEVDVGRWLVLASVRNTGRPCATAECRA